MTGWRQSLVGILMLPLSILPFSACVTQTAEGHLLWTKAIHPLLAPDLPLLPGGETAWIDDAAPRYSDAAAALRTAGMNPVTATEFADAFAGGTPPAGQRGHDHVLPVNRLEGERLADWRERITVDLDASSDKLAEHTGSPVPSRSPTRSGPTAATSGATSRGSSRSCARSWPTTSRSRSSKTSRTPSTSPTATTTR